MEQRARQPRTVIALSAAVTVLIVLAVVVFFTLRSGTDPVGAPLPSPSMPPPTPSDAPSPTPTPRPVFPDETTTGVPAGTVLTASGGLTVTSPGTVLDALDIAGAVVVAAPGVVITRSNIHGSGEPYGILVESGDVTITDSEISGFANGIAFDNWSAQRVNIHSLTDDGVKLGSNVTLADSYIHDLTPGPGAHSDGAQMQDAASNLVVQGNTIDVSAWDGDPGVNAALFLKPDFGPSSPGPVTVAGNFLNGGGYVLYCVSGDDDFTVADITITDNRFGRESGYGPAVIEVPITQRGNVWDDTGRPLGL